MNIKKNLANLVLSLVTSLVISDKEDNQSNNYYNAKRDNEVRQEYYYNNKKTLVIYNGSEPRIVRASKYELGEGLLGVAFPERNLALILDTLSEHDAEKVIGHEKHHLQRPWDS
ncbi:MAG: hypothetical protein AABY07_05090, partial [Nanoarchaeota archaeon]